MGSLHWHILKAPPAIFNMQVANNDFSKPKVQSRYIHKNTEKKETLKYIFKKNFNKGWKKEKPTGSLGQSIWNHVQFCLSLLHQFPSPPTMSIPFPLSFWNPVSEMRKKTRNLFYSQSENLNYCFYSKVLKHIFKINFKQPTKNIVCITT